MQRDDGLLAQHNFILGVIGDPGFTGLDHRVAGEILKRYYPKYGNARASLRYLEQATGSDRKSVVTSRDRLVAGGAFVILREGAGTRPTEYLPNFGISASGGLGTTSTENTASGGLETTAGGGVATTTSASSGGLGTTESFLHVPAYNAGLHVCTVVAPLAADGLEAAAPRAPDFDAVWRAYGRLGNKLKARAAFEALSDPDVEHIVERAAAWEASAKPGVRRMPLEKWLEQERFEEADRAPAPRLAAAAPKVPASVTTPVLRILSVEERGSVFGDWFLDVAMHGEDGPRRLTLHVLAEGRPGPDNDAAAHLVEELDERSGWVGQRVRLHLDGETIVGATQHKVARVVQIVASDVLERGGDRVLLLTLADSDGEPEGIEEIMIEARLQADQMAGQERLTRLCMALGLDGKLEGSEELHHIPFLISSNGDFQPIPAAIEEAA